MRVPWDCKAENRWQGRKYKGVFVGFKVIHQQTEAPDYDGEI